MTKYVSAQEAVKVVQSNDRVYFHSASCAPSVLIKALVERASELQNVEISQIHTEGPAPYLDPKYENNFRVNAFFIGGNTRKAAQEGRAHYVPCFLSEVPQMFGDDYLPIDIAFLNVSPPDKHGYCSLGPSLDVSLEAAKKARIIIAQINPHVPRAHGEGNIPLSMIDYAVEVNEPLYTLPDVPLSDLDKKIGKNVASLIEDGATLQMGIGSIPDATLSCLTDRQHLGVHTEMFSDGIVDLYKSGAIDNRKKVVHPYRLVSSFAMGSQKTFDFINDNPGVNLFRSSHVNDVNVIANNPKVTAINSAIEVDLTGQVCADSIGHRHYSGVGGQIDFIRGASMSEGGKPIIAIPSSTRRGESRIVLALKPGAGVVTTRAHVHYIVTEYGVAHLRGKNLQQRAKALIDIAHPDHREELERSARELHLY